MFPGSVNTQLAVHFSRHLCLNTYFERSVEKCIQFELNPKVMVNLSSVGCNLLCLFFYHASIGADCEPFRRILSWHLSLLILIVHSCIAPGARYNSDIKQCVNIYGHSYSCPCVSVCVSEREMRREAEEGEKEGVVCVCVCVCVCEISQISQKKVHDLFVFKCCVWGSGVIHLSEWKFSSNLNRPSLQLMTYNQPAGHLVRLLL